MREVSADQLLRVFVKYVNANPEVLDQEACIILRLSNGPISQSDLSCRMKLLPGLVALRERLHTR